MEKSGELKQNLTLYTVLWFIYITSLPHDNSFADSNDFDIWL